MKSCGEIPLRPSWSGDRRQVAQGLFPRGSPKEERKMRMSFSPRVEELEKKLKPYFARMSGIVPDAPKEIQEAFEEYKKLVKKEMWL